MRAACLRGDSCGHPVASGYALTFAGFLLLGGRAADRLGRRRVFMAGVLLFIASSLAGGLATSSGMLIGARLVQGLGGAMMSPAALSLLTTSFQGEDRAKALGIYGSIGGAGGAAGVLFGGLLTSGPGWRWVLFVNVPLGIAIVLTAPRLLSGARQPSRLRDLDVPGALLVTGALLLLVYGLTRAPDVGWASARTIGEFAGAAVLLAIFVINEARTARALLPLRSRSAQNALTAPMPGAGGAIRSKPATSVARRMSSRTYRLGPRSRLRAEGAPVALGP